MGKNSDEQPPTCACGQVMFDVGDRKVGDVLTCPWCDRKYQYYGGSHIEPHDPNKKEEQKEKERPQGFVNYGSSADMPKLDIPKTNKNDKTEKTAKYDKIDDKDGARNSQRVTTRDKTSGPPKPKSRPPAEIPGGLMPMLGFMIGFNVLAFVALHFALPTLSDGSRQAPWGDIIPKKSNWPELVTLVLGHIVGFVAWAIYVYARVKPKQDEAAAAKEQLAPKN